MHHRLTPEAQMFLAEVCTTTAPSHIGSAGTAGKRDSSLLPACLFSLLQAHTCLFPLVSQLFSECLWVTTALPWHPHNACEIQGVMQTPEYATSLFLIHSEQVGAILTRMVNISILHFGKYSLNKKPS